MITSRDNETLKLAHKLLTAKKHREEHAMFAVEGEDLVQAAEQAGIEPVHLLVDGVTVEEGLLARISTLPHPARAIGIYRTTDLPTGERDRCLGLFQLGDPGNVGTLLRTADAFGASVSLSAGCADPLSPKALRASVGAIFRVPLVDWGAMPSPRVALVAHGAAPLASVLDGVDGRVSFLLGAEREGLPEEVVAGCLRASIALPGAAESLNVAAAGAIALYESTRTASAPR